MIIKFLDDFIILKYKRFVRKINLLKIPNFILYPTPDCDSYGYKFFNNIEEEGISQIGEKINHESKQKNLRIKLINPKLMPWELLSPGVGLCLKNHHSFYKKISHFSIIKRKIFYFNM